MENAKHDELIKHLLDQLHLLPVNEGAVESVKGKTCKNVLL